MVSTINIVILNLMNDIVVTEEQFKRMLVSNDFMVNFTFIKVSTYNPKDIYKEHVQENYQIFDDVKDKYFDGMIITGASIEKMKFEDVKYWNEICNIMEWSKSNVRSTLHICWGSEAGMYYHFGINRHILSKKISGVYKHKIVLKNNLLVKNFDKEFYVPHSRYGDILEEDICKCEKLDLIVKSDVVGICIVSSKDGKQVFVMGHLEYDKNTLDLEYKRDINLGMEVYPPENYYRDDGNIDNDIFTNWKSYGLLFYQNWLNYYLVNNSV